MRVEWSTQMVFENFHRQQIINRSVCPDCGAFYGLPCGGARKPRAKSHLNRVQRYLIEQKIKVPEISKEEWLRYEELRRMNREKIHERDEFRMLAAKVRAIKDSVQ